jgi:hypothetical protein
MQPPRRALATSPEAWHAQLLTDIPLAAPTPMSRRRPLSVERLRRDQNTGAHSFFTSPRSNSGAGLAHFAERDFLSARGWSEACSIVPPM